MVDVIQHAIRDFNIHVVASEQSNQSMERVAQGSVKLTTLSEKLDMLVRQFKI